MKLSSYVFLLASVALVGCSSEIAEPGAERAPASKLDDIGNVAQPGPSVKGEQASNLGNSFEVGSIVPSEVFVCRKGAFCDDFESVDAPSRWTGEFTDGGDVGRSTSSASLGKGALALTTKPGATSAFLVFEKGQVPATWSGAFSFAMRAADLPKESLSGPELVVKTIDDGVVSLAFVLKPEGLFLEQRATADCKKDRCQTKSTLIGTASAGTWARIDLGIESGSSVGGAPYGRVEIKVNGGPLVSTDLGVPLGNGTTFLRAGITSGDVREAFLDLDDVSFLVR
jgi:hypothetical protein